MQLALQTLGYSIKADGKYGSGTVSTVKSFQRKYGLKVDGIAGDQTLTMLYQLTGNNSPLTPTSAPYSNQSPSYAGQTASVTGGALTLRAGASQSANIVTQIPNGATVSVVMRGNEWTSVLYNGMAGYVMTSYLIFNGNSSQNPVLFPTAAPTYGPQAPSVQAMVLTPSGSLNLREAPNASARILLTIPYGAYVTVTARGNVWSSVYYNGFTGYVMSQYLSFGGAATPALAPTPTLIPIVIPTQAPVYYGSETAYVSTTGGSLNLRESASSTARVILTIPNGSALTVLSRGGVWCSVRYGNTYGYVMTSFLRFTTAFPTAVPTAAPTAVPVPGGGEIAYVTTSGGSLNLRMYAQSNAKILFRVPNGAQVQVTSKGPVWCAVTYQGMSGYVMTSFLSFPGAGYNWNPTQAPVILPTAVPTALPTAAPQQTTTAMGTALVTTSGGTLNLRSEPSAAARIISLIPNASAVTVYSRGTEWSLISYNGQNGYVMTQYLTFLGNGAVPVGDTDAEDDDPSQFTRTLKKGMTGSDVTWVQNRLLELGYSLTVTNLYDDATFLAVKSFQTQNGLTSDGLAGSQTFSMLKSENARKAGETPLSYSTLRVDDSGDGVRQIQTDLKALGYNVTVNGTFDVNTHNAVVAFQQRNGLIISGIADALTRQLLHTGRGKPYSTPVEELPANEGWIQGPAVNDLKLMHWNNEIKPTVKAGQTFTIFDPNTNLSWKLVFYSLGRHADSQPASWRDTQIMNRSFGSTSWNIHPVYVQLPSGQWTMATMHNRPHLYGSITDNGFGGHLCVHFLRDMAEAQKNDPNYGVNNQVTLRNAWKALTGETVN